MVRWSSHNILVCVCVCEGELECCGMWNIYCLPFQMVSEVASELFQTSIIYHLIQNTNFRNDVH